MKSNRYKKHEDDLNSVASDTIIENTVLTAKTFCSYLRTIPRKWRKPNTNATTIYTTGTMRINHKMVQLTCNRRTFRYLLFWWLKKIFFGVMSFSTKSLRQNTEHEFIKPELAQRMRFITHIRSWKLHHLPSVIFLLKQLLRQFYLNCASPVLHVNQQHASQLIYAFHYLTPFYFSIHVCCTSSNWMPGCVLLNTKWPHHPFGKIYLIISH